MVPVHAKGPLEEITAYLHRRARFCPRVCVKTLRTIMRHRSLTSFLLLSAWRYPYGVTTTSCFETHQQGRGAFGSGPGGQMYIHMATADGWQLLQPPRYPRAKWQHASFVSESWPAYSALSDRGPWRASLSRSIITDFSDRDRQPRQRGQCTFRDDIRARLLWPS